MAINFPDTPSIGAVFTGTNGVVYTYDGTRWRVASSVSNLIPIANNAYDLGTNAVRWRSLYIDTINVLSTAASTSSSTGALLVAGGVGIQGALHVRGQIYTQGFLLGPGSEFDPIYSSGTAATITATNISNWNTAYSWGNHAIQGYITTSSYAGVTNHFIPLVDSGIDLGSPSKKWRSLYVSTNTIFLGTTSLTILNGQFSIDGVVQVATTSSLRQGTDSITLSNKRLSIPGKINFGTTGVGSPNTTTYVGEKLVLWDNGGGFVGERHFAIGIENGHMWFSTDTFGDPGNGFKWYSAEQQVMRLDSSGTLEVSKVRVPFVSSSSFNITTTKDYGFTQLEHTFKVDGNKIVLPTGAGFIESGGDIWSLDGLTNKLIFPNNSFIEYGVGTNFSTGSLSIFVLADTSTIAKPNFNITIPGNTSTSLNTWTFSANGLVFPDGSTSTGATIYVPYATSSSFKISTQLPPIGPPPYGATTFEVTAGRIILPSGNGVIQSGNYTNPWSLDSANKGLYFPNISRINYYEAGGALSTGSLQVDVRFGGIFQISLNDSNKTWEFNNNGHIVFPDGSYQTTAATDPTQFYASTGTFTNKTINIAFGQGNTLQIQGNSITSYSGSGPVVALTSMPTFTGQNVNNSNISLDGGSGSYYWQAGSADGSGVIDKAGLLRSTVTSSNALFTFGANGSGLMSVQMDGSLFVGSTLPSNNGGLNTDYGGWLVVESGGKFGGNIDTLGGLGFQSTITGYITFANDSVIAPLNDDLIIKTVQGFTENTWTFSSSNGLVLPAGGAIYNDKNTGQIVIADALGPGGAPPMPSTAFYIDSTGTNVARIIRGNGANNPGWYFQDNGNLTLPNSIIVKGINTNSIAIGNVQTAETDQGSFSVAIGGSAAQSTQSSVAIAIGFRAGRYSQGSASIAIGHQAGALYQGNSSIAFGDNAGSNTQGANAVAVGANAGNTSQGLQTVAIGNQAGAIGQGQRAVAIGSLAGGTNQGQYAVALGNFAGGNNQPANSIVINASGVQLDGSAAGLFIDPIRASTSTNTRNLLYFNPVTKEITTASNSDLTFSDAITLTQTSNSTSTTTGALIVAGGVGIGGNLYVGGEVVVNRLTVQYTTITTTLVQTDDVIQTYNTTNATSTATGALQISGGAGIGRDVWIGGTTRIVGSLQTTRGVQEIFSTSTTATSVTNYDCSNTQIFYHVTTGTQANWTANFTNLNLSSGFATSLSIIISQGTPPYYPSAVQIGGAAQTLRWQGNTTPTMSAFRNDVVTFSILNNGGTYLVLGSSTGF